MRERWATGHYLSGAETTRRRELVWGVVREPPAQFWPQQAVDMRTAALLYEHVTAGALGQVVAAPVDVVLDEAAGLVVQPDITYLSNERLHLVRNQVWGAPDLVVEVESTGTRRRDRVWKRRWYSQSGVREYWLIDAAAETITVFRFGDATRRTRRRLSAPARVHSAVLPAFDAPVSSFF